MGISESLYLGVGLTLQWSNISSRRVMTLLAASRWRNRGRAGRVLTYLCELFASFLHKIIALGYFSVLICLFICLFKLNARKNTST